MQQRAADRRQLAWTITLSALLHTVALGLCSLIVFEHVQIETILTNIASVIEEQDEPLIDTVATEADDSLIDEPHSNPINMAAEALADENSPLTLDVNDLDVSVALGDTLPGIANLRLGDATSGRSQAARSALVKQFGGTSASEAAVATGLKWLAEHQLDDGSWSFDHTLCKACGGKCSQPGTMAECRTGATGLALLAYLGGGHTHEKGNYTRQVRRGLEALVKHGKLNNDGFDLRGELSESNKHAAYYAHGIATIALCETMALTRDPRYRSVAQNAVKFIVSTQDPKGGGWRYEPRQAGDTSVIGWQVMALKSAQNANLKLPSSAFKGADLFLDSVQSEKGAKYAYQDPMSPTPTTTAVGLLCRMYLGWDRQQKNLQDGIAYLDETKPSPNNMYYNYYATQVLHHWGGEEWTRWNTVLRDRLVQTQHQVKDGHLAGSWDVADPHGGAGGRLYMTCLAVMTLEVYYRHLPIYQRENIKVEF
jgi:hypothetical protein